MRLDDKEFGLGSNEPVKATKVVKGDAVIHNVHILDASGSMDGPKFDNSLEAINAEVEKLKLEKDIKYTQTVVLFEGTSVNTICFMAPIKDVKKIVGRTGGYTPLFQAMGETITKLKDAVKKGERVVVTVCTDGGENSSTGQWRSEQSGGKGGSLLKALIKDVEDNHSFNVNYMATKQDLKIIQRVLNADESNTLIHDNTAVGLKMSYGTRSRGVAAYTMALMDGADDTELKSNFFKRVSK